MPHNVLNAKQHAQEAEIVANAGQKGAVTISTNMAGRGVDIRLGGDPPAQRDQIFDLDGLCVIGTDPAQVATQLLQEVQASRPFPDEISS